MQEVADKNRYVGISLVLRCGSGFKVFYHQESFLLSDTYKTSRNKKARQ
jgi:hypothetical protein